MQTATPKTNRTSSNSHFPSFFSSKGEEETAFSQSQETKKSFFKPSSSQSQITPFSTANVSPMARSFSSPFMVQPKLNVRSSNLQTKLNQSNELEETEDSQNIEKVLQSPGQMIHKDIRDFMEPRFAYDFSQVRVHMDAKAAKSAQAIGATAYTSGNNIVFGAGKSPGKDSLTAHELTHVLQQTRGIRSTTPPGSKVSSSVVQRQCEGEVGNPVSYASRASPSLRCNEANTGISDVTGRITAGRRSARVMVNDALTLLNRMLQGTASSTAIDHFRTLFQLGSTGPNPGQIRQAIQIYNRICAWLISDTARTGGGILCLTQNTGDCNGPLLASASCMTGATTRRPINICPDGISADSNITAQTIIHEVAHRFGICTSPPPGSPPGTPPVQERYQGEPQFPTIPALTTSADSYSAFAFEARNLMGSERVRESGHGIEERPPFDPT